MARPSQRLDWKLALVALVIGAARGRAARGRP